MKTKTEINTITRETRTRLPYAELGAIMLREAGAGACQSGYGTTAGGARQRFQPTFQN